MTFNDRYLRDDLISFLKDFLPDFGLDIRNLALPKGIQNISKGSYLGSSAKLDLEIFELEHDGSHEKRVGLAADGFRIMKESASFQALVVYISKSDGWRLSLMTATPDIREGGKVITKLSNPRRFSFALGPGSKVATPTKFLQQKGKVTDLDDLKNRFSVEVVNKEFYTKVAELYTELVGGVRGQGRATKTYEGLLKLPSVLQHSEEMQQFAVRLIGRLVFCWFLREKKGDSEQPLIPSDLLSLKAAEDQTDYYHRVIEPLFFEVLNRQMNTRREQFSKDFFASIPYLNGGLFSPQADDYYSSDESKQAIYHNTVSVPDKWIRGFFEVLEQYNFTVDENTSVDIDLSIDPEMLGRIFENLLAEINPETGESARKSTGSFYTPRQIVEYMVDQSLLSHLVQKTKINRKKLEALATYDLTDDVENPLNPNEQQNVVDALSELTILDPACGSGAFPIGILQKVLYMLQQIDPEAKLWFQRQISNAPPEVRRLIEREFKHKNFDYIRKLGVIRQSIYGVDIQPVATEIARLRCFLTLVVDERVDDSQPNRGIEPLPNLDFKFVTANSLSKLPAAHTGQANLFDDQEGIAELKTIRNEYFSASASEREQIKYRFAQVQKNMFQKMISSNGYAGLTQKLSAWDPFSHKTTDWFDSEWMFGLESFSVVISNPPWGAKLSKDEKLELKELYPSIDSSTPNSFAYFIGLGLEVNPQVLTFVLPDSIMTKDYAKTRSLLKTKLSHLNWYQNSGVPENIRPFVYVEHDVCVFVASQDAGDSINYCRYDYKPPLSIIEKTWLADKEKTINHSFEYVFNMLATDNDYEILEKLSKYEPLSQRLQCHEGIHTGNSRDILFSKEKRGNAKPLFYGGGAGDVIDNYVSKTSGWYVDYRGEAIDKNEGFYASLRDENIFKYPKLYVTRTGNPFKVFFDKATYASNNFFSVQFKNLNENTEDNLKLLMPFLISKIAQYFIRTFAAPRIGSTFIETKIYHLLKLPVPKLDEHQRSELLDLVNQAIKAKESGLLLDFKTIYDKIESFVYESYKLSPEEIKIIEKAVDYVKQ